MINQKEFIAYWEGRKEGFTRGLIAGAILSVLTVCLTILFFYLVWH